MANNILSIIPTDPWYVPDATAQAMGQALFSSFVVNADEVNIIIPDEIRFVDPLENFVSVACPVCGTDISGWWQEAMISANENQFADLTITTPCCNSEGSLNDLVYDWPAGFASYILEARNPATDVGEGELKLLASVLKCELRKVWSKV
jgi:hypothetical protein